MEVICWLAIVMCFVSSAAADNSTISTNSTSNSDEVQQYCQESCEEVCRPCHELVKSCTEEENDCGLEEDPTFGGVCPPHAICVPKNQHCKSILDLLRN